VSAEQNRKIVEDAVAKWQSGNPDAFYQILDENVNWTVIGTTEVSGTYTSRQDFIDGAVKKIGKRIDGQVTPEIVDIVTEGDRLVFRWDGSGKMADGTPYRNRYSWAMTFKDGKVVEGTAYLDTALVDRLMELPSG
jgi:uncharacterized protein